MRQGKYEELHLLGWTGHAEAIWLLSYKPPSCCFGIQKMARQTEHGYIGLGESGLCIGIEGNPLDASH